VACAGPAPSGRGTSFVAAETTPDGEQAVDRRRHRLVAMGFAGSVASAAAVLPPSRPLETDPVMLVVVAATALAAGAALARLEGGRLTVLVTALLTSASLVALAAEVLGPRRRERPGVAFAFLAVAVVSLAGSALRWRHGRRRRAVRPAARPLPPSPPLPVVPPGPPWPAQPATRPLRPVAADGPTLLHGRWQLHPGPPETADTGGFSTLHLATDLWRAGPAVFAKLQSPVPGLRAESQARLQREADLLERMDSPHIVRLLDSGWLDDRFFLVLEYHPAGSLARWLERRFVLELRWVTEAAAELSRGLRYLHEGLERPVIHRDVTPRNALLTHDHSSPRLVLTDLGSARLLDPGPEAGDLAITRGPVFSPHYAPPELVGGGLHGWWGPQTDVYGVAAVLYELLTGLPPYQREARQRGLEFHQLVLDPDVQPVPPGRIDRRLPAILDDLVMAGLGYDPGIRPGRAGELVPVLDRVGRRFGALRIPFADLRRGA
jgi:eukaryotic-like serine/threonine-protein kinase